MIVTHFEMRIAACWQPPSMSAPTHVLATLRPVPYPEESWHQGAIHIYPPFAAYILHLGIYAGTVVLL